MIHGGSGQFRLMYSMPDPFGMTVLYERWKPGGQPETYGEIDPGIGG